MSKALASILTGAILLFSRTPATKGPELAMKADTFSLTTAPVEIGGSRLFPAAEIANRAGGALKLLNDGKLAVLCLGDRCTPVPVDGTQAAVRDGAVFVKQEVLARALHVSLTYAPDRNAVTLSETAFAQHETSQPFSVQVGQPVPDVELADLDGKRVKLSAFRGKRVAVFSWASW